ncbi:MAG: (Fe-S)-binding protein, partial [Nitrospirae bacterium]|nr:(Fe-S)-binding protein [Nitrospirota bacterium]
MAIKQEELLKIDYKPPKTAWMDTPAEIRKGMFCWGAKEKSLKTVDFPVARHFNPLEEDWKLPENWKEIFIEGLRERLSKYRSFQLFMD